ncbi:MAG TPA: Crp/Fnr family transcriptional regulator [Bryobacteraceae bacterium]|nr:Crp/Fnr family transcriptional regulator [Bryobacteraceae bacterium]
MPGSSPRRAPTSLVAILKKQLPGAGVTEVPADRMVYGPEDPAPDFYLVVEGLVVVSRVATDGNETALDVRAAGETFGDAALAGLPCRGESARALLRAKVRRWSAADITALIAQDGEVALAAARILVRRAAEWRERIATMGRETVSRRIGRMLLYMSGKTGAHLPPPIIPALASLANAPNGILSHYLDTFTRQGLVTATPSGVVVQPALADWLRSS